MGAPAADTEAAAALVDLGGSDAEEEYYAEAISKSQGARFDRFIQAAQRALASLYGTRVALATLSPSGRPHPLRIQVRQCPQF